MKKIVSFLMVLMLLVSLSAVAFAADHNFIDSAANAGAPELVDADFPDGEEGCALIITRYTDRATLPDGGKEMESVYNDLRSRKTLNDLPGLDAAGENLAVSDLFDARYTCTHEYHYPVSITVKDLNTANFVALLHFYNGAWQNVPATVDGNQISFTVDHLSPFAVIVKTASAGTGAPTSHQTGEALQTGYIAGAVVFAAAAVWFFARARKVREN